MWRITWSRTKVLQDIPLISGIGKRPRSTATTSTQTQAPSPPEGQPKITDFMAKVDQATDTALNNLASGSQFASRTLNIQKPLVEPFLAPDSQVISQTSQFLAQTEQVAAAGKTVKGAVNAFYDAASGIVDLMSGATTTDEVAAANARESSAPTMQDLQSTVTPQQTVGIADSNPATAQITEHIPWTQIQFTPTELSLGDMYYEEVGDNILESIFQYYSEDEGEPPAKKAKTADLDLDSYIDEQVDKACEEMEYTAERLDLMEIASWAPAHTLITTFGELRDFKIYSTIRNLKFRKSLKDWSGHLLPIEGEMHNVQG